MADRSEGARVRETSWHDRGFVHLPWAHHLFGPIRRRDFRKNSAANRDWRPSGRFGGDCHQSGGGCSVPSSAVIRVIRAAQARADRPGWFKRLLRRLWRNSVPER